MLMDDDGDQNKIQTIPPIQIKPSSVALDNEESLLLEEHIDYNLIQTNTPIAGLDSLSFPVTVSLNKIITYSPGKKLEYKNGGWYYDNKYLDDSELEVFLTQTCWDANSHKTLGDICGVLGWDILLPSGAILLITGAYSRRTRNLIR